ncbi:MAG: hypothetical protein WCL54_05225 [Clostridia bacterium]
MQSTEGQAIFTLAEPDTFVFEADGLDIVLIPCKASANKVIQPGGDVELFDYAASTHHSARAGVATTLICTESVTSTGVKGAFADKAYTLKFQGSPNSAGTRTSGALRFNRYGTKWPLFEIDPSKSAREVQSTFQNWMDKLPMVSEKYRETAEYAWFILWHCLAPADGELSRPAILMSKNHMNNIWAWDICFNALAIAKADPEMAWDQLLVFFDKQAENGMLPDHINSFESKFGFVKPPVFGWTIAKLVKILGVDASRRHLLEIFPKLVALTDWWFEYRDFDDDGMCQYHHGNDSGWDNSTAFDQGYPTEGADLAAHLTLQMETLSSIAEILGLSEESEYWKLRSKQQLDSLLKMGVADGRFISPLDSTSTSTTAGTALKTQSLLNYIPLVLGHRLPTEMAKTLMADLSPGGSFLTEFGLATEAVDSPKYEPDGYWRGPIWAPSTYLIFDGLADIGVNGKADIDINSSSKELALAVAERFCDMCVLQPEMYENFDALTGKGLRCPGYSWTAAVFILLAEWIG